MNHDYSDDNYIPSMLHSVKTIAMVGASPNVRPTYFAIKYLASTASHHPGQSGPRRQEPAGRPFIASLSDTGRPVDMIDIFRNSSPRARRDEALTFRRRRKSSGCSSACATTRPPRSAEAAGLNVVMNRCPKIEYGRLSSEISWMGVNSRTLSSKRAPIPTQGMRLSLNRMSVGGGATAASDRAAKNKSEPT